MANLPLVHLHQLHLFQDVRLLHMEPSVMERSHDFPLLRDMILSYLPLCQIFILYSIMVGERGPLQFPEFSSFIRRK